MRGNEKATETAGMGEMLVGLAAMGCLAAGTIGILKAMSMDHGSDVLFCLLGSVAAFAAVFYMCFGRRGA